MTNLLAKFLFVRRRRQPTDTTVRPASGPFSSGAQRDREGVADDLVTVYYRQQEEVNAFEIPCDFTRRFDSHRRRQEYRGYHYR